MGSNHKKKKKARKNSNYKRPEQLAQRQVETVAAEEKSPQNKAALVASVIAIGIALAIIVAAICSCNPLVTPDNTTPAETTAAVTESTTPSQVTTPTESVPAPSEDPEMSQPVETIPTEPVVTEPIPTESQPSGEETVEPTTEPTAPPDGADPVFTKVKETVYVNKTVNIWNGPGENYNKIGGLLAGETVTRVGIGNNGWSKIYKRGAEAYIRSDFVQKEPLFENTSVITEIGEVTFEEINELVYASKTVNVRSGPSVNSTDVGDLYEDDLVLRIGIGDNGWSRVVYNGAVAYVRSDFLTNRVTQK